MSMTLAQARVSDPVLTEHARGYTNADFVGERVFPRVDMPTRAAKRIIFGKEHFRRYNVERAPGGQIRTITFGLASATVSLTQRALGCVVPREWVEEAQNVPQLNLQLDAVDVTMQVVSLEKEISIANVVRDATRYANANKTVLSGASQWSQSTSTPQKDVLTAQDGVRAAIGRRPQCIVMGGKVYSALRYHPSVRDYFKYTSTEVITESMLATYFGVSEVIVGDGVYTTDGGTTMFDIWGGDVVLFFKAPARTNGRRSMAMPGFGYLYGLLNYPYVEPIRFEKAIASWQADYYDEWSPEMVGPDAGDLPPSSGPG
ncbi:MAG: major capsid protein [Sphingomonadaceae bacterium]|nr:major capsid protein [Sphingomonadaceae bacterium]